MGVMGRSPPAAGSRGDPLVGAMAEIGTFLMP